jgi:hypothetical protein
MRKRTLKQTSAYRNGALSILRNAGAQINESGHKMYTVETTLGTLEISVWNASIMCMFDDLTRAKEHFGVCLNGRLNPHSGKWNWMGGMSHEGDMIDLQDFGHALERILPETRTPNPTLPLAPYAG